MIPRPMAHADLPRAAALSALAGWNQTAADWAVFLRDGAVRVLEDGGEALAGSAAVLPYGPHLAWISMVLVRPDRRRQGHATALMRWATARLAATPCVALDATPAGRVVYARLGFRDAWGFARWEVPPDLRAPSLPLRPLGAADWPTLLALDAVGFGAPRAALLQDFARRLPDAAVVAEDADGLAGFALGRDGIRAPQIGPVLARDDAVARALIAAVAARLGRPALLDLPAARGGLAAWLAAGGGTRLRDFTRMTLGAPLPGDPALFAAVAGPEFG